MKYFLFITGLALAVILSLGCMSLKAAPSAEDGTMYEGSAMGYRGMIHVRVGFENGTITEIIVLESREDMAVGGAAIEELTDLVLMYNTTEIDAVSGATETSRGFLAAIENAIMDL
jgi:fumarate reductase flavoprotein subunit